MEDDNKDGTQPQMSRLVFNALARYWEWTYEKGEPLPGADASRLFPRYWYSQGGRLPVGGAARAGRDVEGVEITRSVA